MKKIILALAVVCIAGLSADVNIKGCLGCHGANFEKAALGKSKIVRDMNVTDIEASLNGYKDGTYGGPMKGIMKGQVQKFDSNQTKEIAKMIKG